MIGEQVTHDEVPRDHEEDIDTDESTAESGHTPACLGTHTGVAEHESDGCV